MADNIYAIDQEPDVEFDSRADDQSFDNLLADEVIVDWLMELEREQNVRAAG